VDALISLVVDGILVGGINLVVGPILFLVSSGILLIVFGALWLAIGVALVRQPARIDDGWRRLRALPLLVQGLAWLLFLPVVAGVWVWRTSWPRVARLTLLGGLAGWNLLMFLPRAV
jgi:hypothetical protein